MEEKEKKLTKKDYYTMIKQIIENSTYENKEELINFLTNQIIQIDNKATKAKEKAQERKVLGDELREKVKAVLSSNPQTANEITEKINEENITKAKVIARLTQLVNNGIVEKIDIQTENKKNIKAYKLI